MLHLASVQVDSVLGMRMPGRNLWIPAEPLAWRTGNVDQEVSLAHLSEQIPDFSKIRTKVEADLISYQNHRLKQILSFLESHSVDLCVFPEYSFIVDESTIKVFQGFSPRMVIVVGLGVPRQRGAEVLSTFTTDTFPPTGNIAAVFSGTDCRIVSKKHLAEQESVTSGGGARCFSVKCGETTISLGVAICKDYLVGGPSMSELSPTPDVLAIPALTSNIKAFSPEAPRDFPRILANHSKYGGSTVFAAGCEDYFVEEGVPLPLPAAVEGVLSIKWHGAPQTPKPLLKEANRVAIRGAMVSRSDGEAATQIVERFLTVTLSKPGDSIGIDDIPRWQEYLKEKPRLSPIAEGLRLYRQASSDDLMTSALAELLSRHLLTPETVSLDDHHHHALLFVRKKIESWLPAHSNNYHLYQLLLSAAAHYVTKRETHDAVTDAPKDQEAKAKCHFSLGLGPFDSDQAVATLSEQQDLLMMFARSAPDGAWMNYRLQTIENPATGNISSHYFVDFFGPPDEESISYFSSVQRIARSVFLRGWTVYGAAYDKMQGHQVWIAPKAGTAPKAREDLGFLVDVMRATGGGCRLEISGVRRAGDEPISQVAFKQDARDEPQSAAESQDGKAAQWFRDREPSEVGIGVRVCLTTPERNDALANLIGAALFSSGECDIVESDEQSTFTPSIYPVEVAHRILHPPHGYIGGRGLHSRRPLVVQVTDLPASDGAVLGTATVARPYVDEVVEVRIPETSRLLHTYVIGRTGVGKTNTLKNISRHDLGRPGPVMVIDPHGDLFDYALRHAALREGLLALDFSGEEVPSVNPIYLDAQDESGVMSNIEELIELIRDSMYYDWAGPRFSDILRLCLHTLVAIADEENGVWASLQDVLPLIEDKSHRANVLKELRKRGKDQLVRGWELHERMPSTEQAEVEQWFISKFGDFRQGMLPKATTGQPAVDLQTALRDGAALLVKVPTVTIGSGPSKFLGSLVVKRVLRYAMEGTFLDHEMPATLIVDEFQNFAGTSFTTLVPEARKFNLGITMANQTLSQLSGFSLHSGTRDDSLSKVILGNVGNLVIQGVAQQDAEYLAAEVGIPARDLSRIEKYSALALLTINGERLDPFTVRLSDSAESPASVAGAVAFDHAREARRKASLTVPIPRIDRTYDDDQDTSTSSSSSFLDDFISRRKEKMSKPEQRDEPDTQDNEGDDDAPDDDFI